jgi:hypothetical protein
LKKKEKKKGKRTTKRILKEKEKSSLQKWQV